MCLIIESKASIPLSNKFLEHVYERNNDGFGFMFIKDNKLEIAKNANGTPDEFVQKYQEVKEYEPFIHVRMKTHGLIDHENTHPYYCGYGIWLMHNGILSIGNKDNTEKSDTWHFIDKVIKPIFDWSNNPHKTMRSEKFKNLIENLIGANNRIVMGDRGGFIVFNENSWYRVPEADEEIANLRVSNIYAWDQDYLNPKSATVTYYTGRHYPNRHVSFTHHRHFDYYREFQGDLVAIDEENFWFTDAEGEFWEKTPAGKFARVFSDGDKAKASKAEKKAIKKMERKKKLEQKQLNLVINGLEVKTNNNNDDQHSEIVIPEPREIITYNNTPAPVKLEVGSIITNEDYTIELIKNWSRAPESVSSLVYSEPEDAARMLTKLLKTCHV